VAYLKQLQKQRPPSTELRGFRLVPATYPDCARVSIKRGSHCRPPRLA